MAAVTTCFLCDIGVESYWRQVIHMWETLLCSIPYNNLELNYEFLLHKLSCNIERKYLHISVLSHVDNLFLVLNPEKVASMLHRNLNVHVQSLSWFVNTASFLAPYNTAYFPNILETSDRIEDSTVTMLLWLWNVFDKSLCNILHPFIFQQSDPWSNDGKSTSPVKSNHHITVVEHRSF